MKHIKFLCLALAFVLVAFGCKKKESEPQQPAGVQKSEQPAKTPAPAKVIETVKQIQPASADTQSETAKTTAADESIRPNDDPELIKSLNNAVAAGDIEKIRSFIDAGADVNTKANGGASLLHIALLGGHEAAAALLISKGVDTHATMTDGTTTLHFAVLRNCKEIANFLIDDGVDVNAIGANFGSPLHLAANTGNTEIAEMLIAKGADVNIKNKRDQTPLTLAKQRKSTAMIELLEKHGAE
jgi:ankyrin repeat protein